MEMQTGGKKHPLAPPELLTKLLIDSRHHVEPRITSAYRVKVGRVE
jgi:hypothetical protein